MGGVTSGTGSSHTHVDELQAVLAMNAAACLTVLAYVLLTLDAPNRVAITAVTGGALLYIGIMTAAGRRLAPRLRRGAGGLLAVVVAVAFVAAWVALDGGHASPLNAAFLLPLALAASSAPAAGALLFAVVAVGHTGAVALGGDLRVEHLLVWISQFGLVTLAASWVGRIRVAQKQRLRTMAGELQELATRDPLTRALNRRGFEAMVGAANGDIDPDAPSALLLVDLDHFKAVNDHHGHQAGDDVLVATAAAIEGAVRDHDLVARLGGEEFIVLLRGVDDRIALRIAERVRVAVEQCDSEVPVTASVGLAMTGQRLAGEKLDDLLGRADRALYAAKEQGRNRTVTAAPEQADPVCVALEVQDSGR